MLVGVPSSATAEEKESEKATEETEAETGRVPEPSNGWKVAIDPGHQGNWVDMSEMEPSAPGSSEMKAKATTGTEGRYSGLREFELNLGVSLVLKEELQMRGYEVLMTREDNDKAISNKERAELAASEHADILVRIHANGSDDGGVHGALTMVPSKENPYIGQLYDECYDLGDMILSDYCEATGFTNLGVGYYDNMSGINWSTIPVTILEMGFMSNEGDDLAMADETFWPVMAEGIADGIDRYFEKYTPVVEETEVSDKADAKKESEEKTEAGTEKESETEIETDKKAVDEKAETAMRALHDELEESMAVKAAEGEKWSAAAVDLTSGVSCVVNDEQKQAASLIKLYIAGTVYERYDEICEEYGKEHVDNLLYNMITVSDNDASNMLTNYLGKGDDTAGRGEVNAYCERNGYDKTVMGRMLLAPKDNGDNLTSVGDCSAFLTKVYNKEVPHADDIINLLMHQDRRSKIPAGLPEGVECGNKTGELDDVENDAAIIFAERPYVLCVMTEFLTHPWDSQNHVNIANLSTEVYRFIQEQLG